MSLARSLRSLENTENTEKGFHGKTKHQILIPSVISAFSVRDSFGWHVQGVRQKLGFHVSRPFAPLS